MALPKMNSAIYELLLPYSKKKIKYRPFIVAEQKILFQALETRNETIMYNAMKEAIKSCTNNSVDPDKIPLFELEWLFINIRMKSVGESTKVLVKCQNEECKSENEIELDLREIKIQGIEDVKDNIVFLNNEIAVRLKLPTYSILTDMLAIEDELENEETGEAKLLFKVICNSIEAVLDKENEYPVDKEDPKEIEEFVNNLTSDQFLKIQEFLDKCPQSVMNKNYKCVKCGHNNDIELRGMSSFF